MKKILYATDCTKRSAPALRYAYRLSRALKAELHALHVYELPPIKVATIRSPRQLRQLEFLEQREIVANFCATHLQNELYVEPVKIEVVESSQVAKTIIAISLRLDIDLVMVGMKDDYSLRGIFAGNIASELLDQLSIPLLIVPNESYFHGLSTLIYATDFAEEDVKAIQQVTTFSEPYNALIKVVHLPLRKESDAALRMQWFEREVRQGTSYPEMVFGLVEDEDVISELRQCIRSEQADILVMMEREHPSLYDWFFHRDLVAGMQSEVSIPILVFNQQWTKLQSKVGEALLQSQDI